MTFSVERGQCEWCNAKEDLIPGTTGNGIKLLVCRDGYACGSRWPDAAPVGRVGAYEGSVGQVVGAGTVDVTVNVVGERHIGKDADRVLAQAEGYRRMVWEILNGNADADPRAFVRSCKLISFEQSQKGAQVDSPEARRLIVTGAVKIDGSTPLSFDYSRNQLEGKTLTVGKRRSVEL